MYDIESKIGKVILYVLGIFFFLSPIALAADLPPDPNNAALLYYQAFLLCPEPDVATTKLLHAVLRGSKPDIKISNCRMGRFSCPCGLDF